jgi:hypothetical protein
MIIMFHFAAFNGFQTIIVIQGLLELRVAVGTVAASTLCNCTNMRVVLHSMESIIQSVTVGCGRSHKSKNYFKTNIIQKITLISHKIFKLCASCFVYSS